MDVHVSFSGHDEVSAALLARIAGERAKTPAAVEAVLRQVATQEQLLLSLGSHPPGTPTGSPPGSPPWRISGALAGSVHVEPVVEETPDVWSGRVGPTAVYGRIQELGGVAGRGHRTTLPPRPHLKPAWDLVRPTVPDTMRATWG